VLDYTGCEKICSYIELPRSKLHRRAIFRSGIETIITTILVIIIIIIKSASIIVTLL